MLRALPSCDGESDDGESDDGESDDGEPASSGVVGFAEAGAPFEAPR